VLRWAAMDEFTAQLPLRDRKRLAAMRHIQTVALELFEAEGFDAVTVERVADAADASASSIYRWFGTKEQLVIWDEYDPTALAALEVQLASSPPLEALRQVVRATVFAAVERDESRIRRRLRLAFANPSVEAASTLQTYEMATLIAGVLATKLGREVDSLEVQVFAHAFVGGILGAMRHWHDTGFATPVDEVFEAPLAVLEHGADLR
jgi:AcrR family transcriptional regulator